MLDLDRIVTARIHPAIGIARVGNSDEHFIGPEVTAYAAPDGGYKDARGFLKRQSARFRIYGYDKNGAVVGELTASENISIEWAVWVANKKAAWYDFLFPLDVFDPNTPNWLTQVAPRRNPQIAGAARSNLIIDAGLQAISGIGRGPISLEGKFFHSSVALGEISTDDAGRLVFLAGRGRSASIYDDFTPTGFSNNVGWHDDVADGPVTARVAVKGRELPVDGAWIVTAPPNYAPSVVSTQTLYDVIWDAYVGWWKALPSETSFSEHVLPLLTRLNQHQWVNQGFFDLFGWQGPYDFGDESLLRRISKPPADRSDPYAELRRAIYKMFRQPGKEAAAEPPFFWPPIYGSASDDFKGAIGSYFTYTATNLQLLQNWCSGDFHDDYKPDERQPTTIDQIPLENQPTELNRAALHWCAGGPFHPGCELTWIVRHRMLYRAPFRIRERPHDFGEPDYGSVLTPAIALADDGPLAASGPGDLTKWMAVPWQTDTASCRAGYDYTVDPYLPTFWPARVPNHVLTEDDYRVIVGNDESKRAEAFRRRSRFFRGIQGVPYLQQLQAMVENFGKFGVVEERTNPNSDGEFPSILCVETGFGFKKPPGLTDTPYEPDSGIDYTHRFRLKGLKSR